ncbi:hypothetical protein IAR55_005077 [Kwoniella newhampshirensis]|uniref:V-type ATPase assembly factor PKR1 n=1 Tax=Kwoniella newhampshirensis TaxID=1651941 RepID=A0AAW0YX58_9TREE
MVTKPSPTPSESDEPGIVSTEQPGFFGLLVKSVFEPGVNPAVVLAMNLCFFLLVLTLFALAFLTGWNKHVLLLFGVTICLWGSMIWFVMEITKVQTRPDNMPPTFDPDSAAPESTGSEESKLVGETKKDR